MSLKIIFGILLPFIGTTLGAFFVFFAKRKSSDSKALSGFAAGVMLAASVWSLIIPAVEMSASLGIFAFIPMLLGLWSGIAFIIAAEKLIALSYDSESASCASFFLAVVLHNIPEGMAVGVAFALALKSPAAFLPAVMMSVGMAMQNIPEGAIISLPLKNGGSSKKKAFILGSLSGIVEPIAAIFTLVFASFAASILPYLLGFAAGAMIFVTADELLPKAKSTGGVLWFCIGFSVMMVLDIALG